MKRIRIGRWRHPIPGKNTNMITWIYYWRGSVAPLSPPLFCRIQDDLGGKRTFELTGWQHFPLPVRSETRFGGSRSRRRGCDAGGRRRGEEAVSLFHNGGMDPCFRFRWVVNEERKEGEGKGGTGETLWRGRSTISTRRTKRGPREDWKE